MGRSGRGAIEGVRCDHPAVTLAVAWLVFALLLGVLAALLLRERR